MVDSFFIYQCQLIKSVEKQNEEFPFYLGIARIDLQFSPLQ